MLTFLGRGSAFANENNFAYFVYRGDLVLLDCPSNAFRKLKEMEEIRSNANIYVLVTHTHGDHSGGVGTFLQYVWFVLKKKVTVVAPSDAVRNDLITLLNVIEGCEQEWYDIISASELDKEWFISSIPTTHVRTLEGKCFGYHLSIDGQNVIYTGDTSTLEPFEPLLQAGDYLYSEAAFYNSGVHLCLDEYYDRFSELSKREIKVYLMHLDEEEKIADMIRGTSIQLAPLRDR